MLNYTTMMMLFFFFFQAEDGIRDIGVTGVRRVLFRSPGDHTRIRTGSEEGARIEGGPRISSDGPPDETVRPCHRGRVCRRRWQGREGAAHQWQSTADGSRGVGC